MPERSQTRVADVVYSRHGMVGVCGHSHKPRRLSFPESARSGWENFTDRREAAAAETEEKGDAAEMRMS